MVIAFAIFGQNVKPTSISSIANSTTTFGAVIPAYRLILNSGTRELYMIPSRALSSSTLTTSGKPVNISIENALYQNDSAINILFTDTLVNTQIKSVLDTRLLNTTYQEGFTWGSKDTIRVTSTRIIDSAQVFSQLTINVDTVSGFNTTRTYIIELYNATQGVVMLQLELSPSIPSSWSTIGYTEEVETGDELYLRIRNTNSMDRLWIKKLSLYLEIKEY
jgi:hypothetical protein